MMNRFKWICTITAVVLIASWAIVGVIFLSSSAPVLGLTLQFTVQNRLHLYGNLWCDGWVHVGFEGKEYSGGSGLWVGGSRQKFVHDLSGLHPLHIWPHRGGSDRRQLHLHMIVPLVFFSWAATLLWIFPWRRRRNRVRRGLCIQCGYNLKGSPSGQCPECGQVNTAMQQNSLIDPPSAPSG